MDICADRKQCHFLRLPAELRERIYAFYFENDGAFQLWKRQQPIDPALTKVSKQLRSETIPIYYSNYTLSIQSYIRCSYHGQVWLRTEKCYHDISPLKLKHINHFKFQFALIDRYTGERIPIEFHLDLLRRFNSYRLRHSFARHWFTNPHRIGDPADFEELISALRRHLTLTLNKLIMRPGIGNLTSEHLDVLTKVDPESLPLRTMSLSL